MDKIGEYTLKVMKYAGWYNSWLFSFIKPYLVEPILEVGAGIGNFTTLLANEVEVVAIDINEDYLRKLKKLKSSKVSVGFGDLEKGDYFFRRKKFNTILCLNVLEHIKNDRKALENANSMLLKKGKLLLLVPAHELAYGSMDEELGHYRRYDKKAISKLLKSAGFTVVKIRYLNFLGLIGWFINSKILKRKILPRNQLLFFDKIARPLLLLEEKLEPPLGLSVLAIAEK